MMGKVALFPALMTGVGDRSTARVERIMDVLRADTPAITPFVRGVRLGAVQSGNGSTPESLVDAAQRVLGRGEPIRAASAAGLCILGGRWLFCVFVSLADDPTLVETVRTLKQAVTDLRAGGVRPPHVVVVVEIAGTAFGRAETEALDELVQLGGLPSLVVFVVSRALSGGGFLDDQQFEQALESGLGALLTSDVLSDGGMVRSLLSAAGRGGVALGSFGAMSAGYQLPELVEHVVTLRTAHVLAAILDGTSPSAGDEEVERLGDRVQQELERSIEGAGAGVRAKMEVVGREALAEVAAKLDEARDLALPQAMSDAALNFRSDWHEKRVRPRGNSALSDLAGKFKSEAVRLLGEVTRQPGSLRAVRQALETVSTWVAAKRPSVQAAAPDWRVAEEPGVVVIALRKRRMSLAQAAVFSILAVVLTGQALLQMQADLLHPSPSLVSLVAGLVLAVVAASPVALAVCNNRVQAGHIRALPEALKKEAAEFLEEYYDWLAGRFLVRAQEELEKLREDADVRANGLNARLRELEAAARTDGPVQASRWNVQLLRSSDFEAARAAFVDAVSVTVLAERALALLNVDLLSADGADVVAGVRQACRQEVERFLREGALFSGLSPESFSLPSLLDMLDEGRNLMLPLDEPLVGGPALWPVATILAMPPAFFEQAEEALVGGVSPVTSAEPTRLSIVSVAFIDDVSAFLARPALAGIGGV
jgi:hypothetical protein